MGGRLRARDVIRAALRTYRERFGRVAGTAFVVFGAVAVVDAIATILVIDHVSSPVGDAIASTAAAVFVMAGVVVYAGILDKVVGAHLHGHPDLSIREVWNVLPLGRLGAADVWLALATLVGLALFVIPGVVILTVWSLVGPVITIENRSVASAFGRSWQLVRPHFWLTLCLVTLPLQIEQADAPRGPLHRDLRASTGAGIRPQRTARHGDRVRCRTRRSGARVRAHRPNKQMKPVAAYRSAARGRSTRPMMNGTSTRVSRTRRSHRRDTTARPATCRSTWSRTRRRVRSSPCSAHTRRTRALGSGRGGAGARGSPRQHVGRGVALPSVGAR